MQVVSVTRESVADANDIPLSGQLVGIQATRAAYALPYSLRFPSPSGYMHQRC